jgi:uncharacterized protein
MPISLYQASVPVFVRMLSSLSANLDKGAAHAAEHKFDPAALLTARLYPDMYTLTGQVQIATDQAKGAAARLADVEIPKMADTEKSFVELSERIAKTIAFLDTLKPERIDGRENAQIQVPVGRDAHRAMTGQSYLLDFVLPNFYFHVTTAYAILRHNGVPIGKRDFIGIDR